MEVLKKVLVMFFSTVFFSSCLENDTNKFKTFEEQLEIDLVKIEAYLDANDILAVKDETGIYYVIHEEGEGVSPVPIDRVTVDYEGRLFNDKVFDSSLEIERKPTYELETLIPAWQLMLPKIKEGGRMTIYAPSGYCYGQRTIGIIDANSNLIFDIELIAVNPED